LALVSGSPVSLSTTDTLKKALLFGSSVVDGEAGATEGEADTWLVGNELGISISKAGKGGNTTTQSRADLTTIIPANGVPEIAIFGASTNDNGDAGIQAKYEGLINDLLGYGVTTVICRCVVTLATTVGSPSIMFDNIRF